MPHLVKEYAKHCGVQVGQPVLGQHYFPIKYDKYIIVDTSGSSQASKYPYWSELISLLQESLPSEVALVRIVSPDEKKFHGEDLALGNLSIKQINYIINNAMAHIGVYGFTQHIASAFDVPTVVMYSNNMPEYCGPAWSDKCINIKPKYKNGKPSFASEEKKPVVFSIYPDTVVSSLNKLIPDICEEPVHEAQYIGRLYHHKLYEVVPDFYHPIKELHNQLLNVRMDLNHNEDNLSLWLKSHRCSIISSKEISLDLIQKFKRNIPFINFFCEVGEFPKEDYLHELAAAGIGFKLFSSGGDSKELRKEMNRYFDFSFDLIKLPSEWPEEIEGAQYFNSNKQIFCKDGIFMSKAHMKAKQRDRKIIKSLDFLEELDHFYLYNDKT